jgi:hypothetical protein
MPKIRPLILCKKKKRLLTLQEFSAQTLSSRIGEDTEFDSSQLEGEIDKKYLSESLYEDLQTIIKDTVHTQNPPLDTVHPQNPPLDTVHTQNSPLDIVHPQNPPFKNQ